MNKLLKKLLQVEKEYSDILHLTANENVLSGLANRFYESKLSFRYDMGEGKNGIVSHGNFAAKGMPEIAGLIREAENKLNAMLGAGYSTLYCLSGVHAMMSVLISTTKVGDVVMTVPSKQGGHFCTKGIIELTGRKHLYTEYDFKKLTFDIEKTAKAFKKAKARLLYIDASVYLNPHPIKKLRKALGNDAIIVYDASHTIGLMMGGRFQSPLKEGANIISANTHKTLPGPHRGLLAFRDKAFGTEIDQIIRGNFYSSVQTSSVLALCISILELDKWGKEYASQIIKNANALASALAETGLNVRKASKNLFSHNHQVHVYTDLNNEYAVRLFLDNNISVNTSKALGEKLFLRLGVQEVTRRGMKETDMVKIAKLIKDIFDGKNVKDKVIKFNNRFKTIRYGFEYE